MKLPPAVQVRAEVLAQKYPADLIAVYSMNETCVWASPTHETILGYTPAECLGRSWTEFVAHGDHAHAGLAANDAMLNGQSIEFGFEAVAKSGKPVQLRGQATISINRSTHEGFLFFRGKLV